MSALTSELLNILGVLWAFLLAYLVPTSPSAINLLHVAVWVPVVLFMLTLTGGTIRRLPAKGTGKATKGTGKATRGTGKATRGTEKAAKDTKRKRITQEEYDRQHLPSYRTYSLTLLGAVRKQYGIVKAIQVGRDVEFWRTAQRRYKENRAWWRTKRGMQTVLETGWQNAPIEAEQARQANQRRERRAAKKRVSAPKPAPEPDPAPVPAPEPSPAPAPKDPISKAFGTDPNRVYEFRYRVVDMDALITSNTDSGTVNPDYDQTLQPRQRDRAASQRQIEQVARSLVPESMLWDFHQLDKGAPIIGSDMMVESGNGRTLALRRARTDFVDQWENYQGKLRDNLAAVGLDESDLAGINNPVLVRERVTEVDRAAFAREANAPPVLQMSTLETALVDSRRISDAQVMRLVVKEDQSIDQALRAKGNSEFVRSFMQNLSENESAMLMRKNGTLNQMGIWRIKGALFTKVFPGEAGQRIADTFLESLDSTTKNFENAISSSLPVLARAESMISSGQRAADMSMAEDVSKALDMLARLKETGMPVNVYVEQANMFERELTPFQERLLLHFDEIGRSPKQIRAFLNAYAQAVEDAPDPAQETLFGPEEISKDELFDRITKQERKAA